MIFRFFRVKGRSDTKIERGNAKAQGAGAQDKTLVTTEMEKVFMVVAKNVCVKLKKTFLAKKY